MRYSLLCHPAAAGAAIGGVEAEVSRVAGAIVFRYSVAGAGALALPDPSAPVRTDGLWRTTCFEAFIRPGAGEAYLELNFSPSSAWAGYRFSGYRNGMADAELAAPAIKLGAHGRTFKLEARIDMGGLGLTPSARLGLAAILEEKSGATTYWALAHGSDKPDFHRADGFIARLPRGSAA